MAQARTQQSALGATAQAVGDTAQGTASFIGSVFNGIKNTVGYGISLLNADLGVGAALGLAAGTAAAFFTGGVGLVAGLPLIGGAIGSTLGVACCGAAVGAVAGGHMGRSRVQREKAMGKPVREPSLLNKQAIMGFGLGAAGLAAVVGTVGTGGLLGAAALIGGAALPVAGAYYGGQLGARRMIKDYSKAVGQQSRSQSSGHAHARMQEAHQSHAAHQSYKNSVTPDEWAEASSYMRDSANGHSQGSHAAKVLADRAAAQEQLQSEQA